MSTIFDIGYRLVGMNDIELTFGERLEDWLDKAGLLQEEFAERIGVSQSTVSAWVNGQRPGRINCYRIADYFGLPRRDVVLWAGHRPKHGDLIQPNDKASGPAGGADSIVDSLRDPRVRLFLRRAGNLTDEQWEELLTSLGDDDEQE